MSRGKFGEESSLVDVRGHVLVGIAKNKEGWRVCHRAEDARHVVVVEVCSRQLYSIISA